MKVDHKTEVDCRVELSKAVAVVQAVMAELESLSLKHVPLEEGIMTYLREALDSWRGKKWECFALTTKVTELGLVWQRFVEQKEPMKMPELVG